jgi:hypothetical protein
MQIECDRWMVYGSPGVDAGLLLLEAVCPFDKLGAFLINFLIGDSGF